MSFSIVDRSASALGITVSAGPVWVTGSRERKNRIVPTANVTSPKITTDVSKGPTAFVLELERWRTDLPPL